MSIASPELSNSQGLPVLAIVMNVQTPYRIHLHRRFAREIPQIRLASLYTHDVGDQAWARQHVEEINPVYFGQGHAVADQGHPRWMRRDWSKGSAIIRWLKDHKAAAVLVGGYDDLTRLRIFAWCRRNRVPCFVCADSNIKGDKATGLRRLVKRQLVGRVVRSVSGALVFGSRGAEYFRSYGARPESIFYSPCEPDYDLINGVPAQTISAVLARFGLDPARRRFIVCGRLVGAKRVDMVIDAFRTIAAQRPDFDLVVIVDGPLAPQLKERVEPGLRSRVCFTGFLNDQAAISALYKASHVFVIASDYEPWGLVVNESVAAGMAIVSSDAVGSAPELVHDGVNGRVFPAGDLNALIDCLREVSAQPRLDQCRAGSAQVLADWRRRGDPVEGLRKALRFAGISLEGTPEALTASRPPLKRSHAGAASGGPVS
jgi:glycosyltransferase involved in cell wall biosynthesis